MKERYLVTGGAGFIGSHIVVRLVKEGRAVRVLDDFSSGTKEHLSRVINKIELIKGDIRNKRTCFKAARGIDFVLHQAALRSVPKSMGMPGLYNEVNIGGTLNMLLAAFKNKIRHFVFASSSSIYGDVENFPEKETFVPYPISPYALTKLTGEHYCRIFSRHHGLATTSLRYFNVFGERQSLDDEYAVVVPKFISCILKNEPPPIYGTGRQSRDFTYVGNVVDANLRALRRANDGKGDVFNIANGKDYSILELVRILNRIAGKKIKPVFLAIRPGDVFKTRADISRAQKVLGYYPSVDFEKGLRLAMDYFKQKLEQA
ncbi:MAG: SDR family oxidoreductase [Candidatus Omnitrophica bacterium]|nr:SDR family oxidoreductase [Candidatus Omnitrophota bacterium]